MSALSRQGNGGDAATTIRPILSDTGSLDSFPAGGLGVVIGARGGIGAARATSTKRNPAPTVDS